MPITKTCLVCNATFSVPPSKDRLKYCSVACYGIAQRGRSTCTVPGGDDLVVGHGFGTKHYLRYRRYGDPCKFKEKSKVPRKGMRKVLTLTCLWCGKTLENPTAKRKYCSDYCSGLSDRKPYIIKKGYRKILVPDHPRADGKGYVFEHVILLESKLGRSLNPGEVTHHLNGNKQDNSPDNLSACPSQNDHMKIHRSKKK